MSRDEGERRPLLGSPRIQQPPNNTLHCSGRSRHCRGSQAWSSPNFSFQGCTHEPHRYSSDSGENEPIWADQFTAIDWIKDSVVDAHRVQKLRSKRGFRDHINLNFDRSQGWLLSALVGFFVATIAFAVDVAEPSLSDWMYGICSRGLFTCKKRCCLGDETCNDWIPWSTFIKIPHTKPKTIDFCIYVFLVVLLSTLACLLTLTTKKTASSAHQIFKLNKNLEARTIAQSLPDEPESLGHYRESSKTYYSAAGSGVAEVRVILSGFVLHEFLGVKTLVIKTIALIFSVSSGLSVGKEGPFIHIASCVGNIACRIFPKYEKNDGKRREVLCAAAAAGITVAFGAPIGGVLFTMEEMAYFFSAKTLFRTFFCCTTAALALKFFDPYGTYKIVMLEVRYTVNWKFFELAAFILAGIIGGATGAIFIKACRSWARFFRPFTKNWPLVEVIFVSFITGTISFWNPFTQLSVVKLLYHLTSPCDLKKPDNFRLCPQNLEEIGPIISSLGIALVVKGLLTVITFGIKVPGGIYVPSMVVGSLAGRIVGHLMQMIVLRFPNSALFESCAANIYDGSCINPGIYALITAASTLCGVTRLSVTLVVIHFELSGSLDYVIPFSLAILVAKWTADAIERLSIYDLVIETNSFPFLNNRHKPIFTSELAVLVRKENQTNIIDVSHSPLVSAKRLRSQLEVLREAGRIDGGLPIICNEILVGLISALDLEYALSMLKDESKSVCQMIRNSSQHASEMGVELDRIDFTQYIDSAPLSLDIHSPMDLVYECFAKLGLRYVCVLRKGRYVGLIHKKTFVCYVRQLMKREKCMGKA
ncbi:H(+)/Cl(-) exchange transporter 3 [Podosphaera aphanis]|nr:H(+)/Cl(-) exchange transporter 3 [Podosphaera aphanis]